MRQFYIGDFHNIVSNVLDGDDPSILIRTWLFDPPYNINFRYGDKVDDSQTSSDYSTWIGEAALEMKKLSRWDANLFLVIYPEIAARLIEPISEQGWKLNQWVSWVYPSNIGHSKSRFTRASRAVLWFTIGEPDSFMKAVQQPFKNPNDRRIKEHIANGRTGVNLYDWWEINLRKNVSKGHAGWYNQLPFELVERIVKTTTREGEWVGDLMAGSGTLFEVASTCGRHTLLNDIDERALQIWLKPDLT